MHQFSLSWCMKHDITFSKQRLVQIDRDQRETGELIDLDKAKVAVENTRISMIGIMVANKDTILVSR